MPRQWTQDAKKDEIGIPRWSCIGGGPRCNLGCTIYNWQQVARSSSKIWDYSKHVQISRTQTSHAIMVTQTWRKCETCPIHVSDPQVIQFFQTINAIQGQVLSFHLHYDRTFQNLPHSSFLFETAFPYSQMFQIPLSFFLMLLKTPTEIASCS